METKFRDVGLSIVSVSNALTDGYCLLALSPVAPAVTVAAVLLTLCSGLYLLAQIRSLVMVGLFLATRGKASQRQQKLESETAAFVWPTVTVQLPVYRETAVLRRLLDAVTALHYPTGQWNIQVIDDSEGEDAIQTRRITEAYAGCGIPVDYLHRGHRTGFKAGALNFGTAHTQAEVIALLDAEFIPRPEFLLRTIPQLTQTNVACVQARFIHYDCATDALIQLQGVVFDRMLGLEAEVRRRLGASTFSLAGGSVWRREAIIKVGGWCEAYFTSEDIDLSFRLIHSGWRVLYEPEVLAEAEQVAAFGAYKIQQRRWSRGVFRNFLDHGSNAFRGGGWLQAMLDISLVLLQTGTGAIVPAFLLIDFIGIAGAESVKWVRPIAVIVSLSVLINAQMFEFVVVERALWPDWRRRIARVFPAMRYVGGLTVALFQGVLDTILGRTTEFIRTPKTGSVGTVGGKTRGYSQRVRTAALIETGLSVAGLFATACCARNGDRALLLATGLGTIFFGSSAIASIREILGTQKRR